MYKMTGGNSERGLASRRSAPAALGSSDEPLSRLPPMHGWFLLSDALYTITKHTALAVAP